MDKNNDKINTDNISQELFNLEAQLSQLNPAIDDLAERIRKPKDELDKIVGRLSNNPKDASMPNFNAKSFLDYTSKILPVISIIGIILGVLTSFKYLKYINTLFLFPEIMAQPTALIGILFYYSVIAHSLFGLFLFSYLFKAMPEEKIIKIFFCLLSIVCLIPFIFIYLLANIILDFKSICTNLLFMTPLIFPFLDNWINLFLKGMRKSFFDTLILFILSLFVYFIISLSINNYNDLRLLRFIEKPQDSSWYLIHNGNTTSENINGLSKRDILAQKDIFNAKDCTTLKNKDSNKKCQDDNKDIFNNRDNALYGYMAWNLGNTKVFCPVSVDFFDGKDNTEKSAKCLVIDGKYLQLISHHYLSQK